MSRAATEAAPQYVAVQKSTGIVPKFSVTEIEGDRTRTKKVWNKEKKTFADEKEVVHGGYLLKFPKGHSIVVDTMEEVHRLVGDPEVVELVNLETSDVHGAVKQPLAKQKEIN